MSIQHFIHCGQTQSTPNPLNNDVAVTGCSLFQHLSVFIINNDVIPAVEPNADTYRSILPVCQREGSVAMALGGALAATCGQAAVEAPPGRATRRRSRQLHICVKEACECGTCESHSCVCQALAGRHNEGLTDFKKCPTLWKLPTKIEGEMHSSPWGRKTAYRSLLFVNKMIYVQSRVRESSTP